MNRGPSWTSNTSAPVFCSQKYRPWMVSSCAALSGDFQGTISDRDRRPERARSEVPTSHLTCRACRPASDRIRMYATGYPPSCQRGVLGVERRQVLHRDNGFQGTRATPNVRFHSILQIIVDDLGAPGRDTGCRMVTVQGQAGPTSQRPSCASGGGTRGEKFKSICRCFVPACHDVRYRTTTDHGRLGPRRAIDLPLSTSFHFRSADSIVLTAPAPGTSNNDLGTQTSWNVDGRRGRRWRRRGGGR